MGRRSEGFERRPNDYYATPPEAVRPLLPFLRPGTRFIEPCAGDGALIDTLTYHGHKCVGAYDIDPRRGDIQRADALSLRWRAPGNGVWISNLPWTRDIMHALIRHLCLQAPLFCLHDAEWMHTGQSAPLLPYLRKIISIGRVQWMPGSGMTSKDSSCWYLFDGTRAPGTIEFHGRS